MLLTRAIHGQKKHSLSRELTLSPASTCYKETDSHHQAPIAQQLESAIRWINQYSVINYLENQLRYSLNRIFGVYRCPPFEKLGPNLLFDCEFHYNDNCFLMDALLSLHIRYISKCEFCL